MSSRPSSKPGGLLAPLMIGAVTVSSLFGPPIAAQSDDWASLGRYREANRRLEPPSSSERRVVFYGNSITDAWAGYFETCSQASLMWDAE